MASCFTTVSKDEILAVYEAASMHQQIPRKRQNLACRCLYSSVEKNFLTEFATKSQIMIPETLSIDT